MTAFFRKRPFLLFIAPGFLLYSLLVIYPILAAMHLSLFRWNGIGEKIFVGLGNYRELFTDAYLMGQFSNALGNSLKLFLLTVFVQLPVQIAMAYMIYSRMKGHRAVQAIIFAPQFITTPVIVFIFRLILDSNVGVLNTALAKLGLSSLARPWLGMPETGIILLFIMITWGGIGVGMTFLAGSMNMIGRDGLEAAYLEGAGFWTRLVLVILPQIKATIINLILIGYIYCMTMFDFSYILSGGSSGGVGGSLDVMALFFYRIAFGDVNPVGGKISSNSVGMGTTVACVLFLLLFVISLFRVLAMSREEEA
ncbi:MAG: sugar ABC transporter permease [Spirochaetaceae bacterium]|nr:sugar ABC transporter permease [Spirochaetaceae bacterium]